MGREGHCNKIPLAYVGSAHSGWTTLGLPQPKAACASQVYTAQTAGYSARVLFQVGSVFHALSGLSHSGSWVLHKDTDPDRLCILCPSQVWQFALLEGFSCISVSKESACNAGDPGSTPRLGRSPGKGVPALQQSLAFWPWLSQACLSASGEGGPDGQLACSHLLFVQSFVL